MCWYQWRPAFGAMKDTSLIMRVIVASSVLFLFHNILDLSLVHFGKLQITIITIKIIICLCQASLSLCFLFNFPWKMCDKYMIDENKSLISNSLIRCFRCLWHRKMRLNPRPVKSLVMKGQWRINDCLTYLLCWVGFMWSLMLIIFWLA